MYTNRYEKNAERAHPWKGYEKIQKTQVWKKGMERIYVYILVTLERGTQNASSGTQKVPIQNATPKTQVLAER